MYNARDVEEDIKTVSSSLKGEHHLFGLNAAWGASFAESFTETPYDFEMVFHEPSSDSSGMKAHNPITGSPEQLIPLAWNNFPIAFLDTAFYRHQKNRERERVAFFDIEKEYAISDLVSGTAKIGGRYRGKNRMRESSTLGGAYWLSRWSKTEQLPDGTVRQKNLHGTRFGSMLNQSDAVVSMRYFLDSPPMNRDVYGKFALYPLVNREAIRQWFELNRYGASGVTQEFQHSVEDDADYYNIEERVSAAYTMNTLNLGPQVTIILGVRIEQEDNDYKSKYTPTFLDRFPNSGGPLRDTTLSFIETVWLPSLHAIIRPLDFMNVRLAAYRSLARPDFNDRLEKFLAVRANRSDITIGNPGLRAAKAWNYEINSSVFGNDLGLISMSVFYKDIKDMYHLFNQVKTKGNQLMERLGIRWPNPFAPSFVYFLTVPYNSSRPTKVWGIEFEHQTSLGFLPGFLKNVVLNYNFSLVRSETFQTFYSERQDSFYVIDPNFGNYWQKFDTVDVFEGKTRLEDQPDFFANISLGYDVGEFSGRVSLFHQGEYTRSFTARSRGDRIVGGYSRLDLSMKQRITGNISILLDVKNLTNTEEPTSDYYAETGWDLPRTTHKYGMSADLGVRIEL
jgi:TonB-dependent receptor